MGAGKALAGKGASLLDRFTQPTAETPSHDVTPQTRQAASEYRMGERGDYSGALSQGGISSADYANLLSEQGISGFSSPLSSIPLGEYSLGSTIGDSFGGIPSYAGAGWEGAPTSFGGSPPSLGTSGAGAATGGMNIGSMAAGGAGGVAGAGLGYALKDQSPEVRLAGSLASPAVSFLAQQGVSALMGAGTGAAGAGAAGAGAAGIGAGAGAAGAGAGAGASATGAVAGGAAAGMGAAALTAGVFALPAIAFAISSYLEEKAAKARVANAKKTLGGVLATTPQAYQQYRQEASDLIQKAVEAGGMTPEQAVQLYQKSNDDWEKTVQESAEYYTGGTGMGSYFGQTYKNPASDPSTMNPVYMDRLKADLMQRDSLAQRGLPIPEGGPSISGAVRQLAPDYYAQNHNYDIYNQPEFQDQAAGAAYQGPYKDLVQSYWNDPNFSFDDIGQNQKYGIGSNTTALGLGFDRTSELGQAWQPGAYERVMGIQPGNLVEGIMGLQPQASTGGMTSGMGTGAVDPGVSTAGAGKRSPTFLTPELDNRSEVGGAGKLGGGMGQAGDAGVPFGMAGKRQGPTGGMGIQPQPRPGGGRPGGQAPFGGVPRGGMMPQASGGRPQPNRPRNQGVV